MPTNADGEKDTKCLQQMMKKMKMHDEISFNRKTRIKGLMTLRHLSYNLDYHLCIHDIHPSNKIKHCELQRFLHILSFEVQKDS